MSRIENLIRVIRGSGPVRAAKIALADPGFFSGIGNRELAFMLRLRSQVLGIVVLALAFLLIACIRYYFKLG